VGITKIESKPPKIRPSKTKKRIELNQRRNNLFVDSSLGIISFLYQLPHKNRLNNHYTILQEKEGEVIECGEKKSPDYMKFMSFAY